MDYILFYQAMRDKLDRESRRVRLWCSSMISMIHCVYAQVYGQYPRPYFLRTIHRLLEHSDNENRTALSCRHFQVLSRIWHNSLSSFAVFFRLIFPKTLSVIPLHFSLNTQVNSDVDFSHLLNQGRTVYRIACNAGLAQVCGLCFSYTLMCCTPLNNISAMPLLLQRLVRIRYKTFLAFSLCTFLNYFNFKYFNMLHRKEAIC